MSVAGRIRSSLLSRVFIRQDSNFIGFDKYRIKGAFHWNELNHNLDYRRKIEAVKEFLRPTHVCLDLGCGDGAYMYAISKLCRSVVGIDADYHAVCLAKRKFVEHRLWNCLCIQSTLGGVTATRIGIGLLLLKPSLLFHFLNNGGEFDLVYAMDLVEHLPDPHQLIRVAARMVKPAGLVVIGTPLFVSEDLVSPYHVREFNRNEIRNLVSTYLHLNHEIVLPMRRKDSRTYEDGFYISVGTKR